MRGESRVLYPRTADGFRATVSALRSLDGSKGVSVHTFPLPENPCVRLLINNLGKEIPWYVFGGELKTG